MTGAFPIHHADLARRVDAIPKLLRLAPLPAAELRDVLGGDARTTHVALAQLVAMQRVTYANGREGGRFGARIYMLAGES